MQTIKKINQLKKLVSQARAAGQVVALVPTMGAFHEGHLSLIKTARLNSDLLVVSLFVNPTQFGPGEDYQKYPRSLAADKKLAAAHGVDLLFTPTVAEMYAAKPLTKVVVEDLSQKLCGLYRPGHFSGVATVVAKLFHIVQPDKAYFGEKDWQQLLIIKQMVKDLNFPVQVIGLPTVRAEDGLAMSSRNKYLTAPQRQAATIIYKALKRGAHLIKQGARDTSVVIKELENYIATEPLVKLQYLTICHPRTLVDIKEIKAEKEVLIAVAAFVGAARLIDNIVVKL